MTPVLPSDPVHLAAGSALVGALLGLLRPLASGRARRGTPEVPRQAVQDPDDEV